MTDSGSTGVAVGLAVAVAAAVAVGAVWVTLVDNGVTTSDPPPAIELIPPPRKPTTTSREMSAQVTGVDSSDLDGPPRGRSRTHGIVRSSARRTSLAGGRGARRNPAARNDRTLQVGRATDGTQVP